MSRAASQFVERNSHRTLRPFAALVAAAALGLAPVAPPAWATRTPLKPGVNIFTPEQDIQIGRQNAAIAEEQLLMLDDLKVDGYLNRLGQKLVAHAPGYKFAYQFYCVNDLSINAFALPGGFIFINRGAIEAADDEAQLAGVMAHEISHVALRHGTNQATKAQLTEAPLAILGGMVGGGAVGGLLARLGASFGLNSILLKYSRTDETQADVLGTQILYDSGYDPRALAQFFEKIQADSKGKAPIEFFASHPNPDHRTDRVEEEVDNLGGPEPDYRTDSPEFQSIKRYLLKLPPPPKKGTEVAGGAPGKPEPPSEHTNKYETDALELRYPDNWKSSASGTSFTLTPQGGVVKNPQGQAALAYGVMFNQYEPKADNAPPALDAATDQLIASLQKSNPGMRIARERERIRVDGEEALSIYLANPSPVGGEETDWVVTVLRPDGLFAFICVAPQKDWDLYSRAFQDVVNSIHFRR